MPKLPTRLNFDPRVRIGRRAGRRFLFEWAAVGFLGLVVVLLASLGRLTTGVDHLVYDRFLSLRAEPLLSDIVVIEIDNASIAQLGPWPWPRSVHAKLLEKIAAARPAAVIDDVLFTEPNAEDAELARAVALSPTYLPILLAPSEDDGRYVVVEPTAPLAHAAAGLGHGNFEADSDGIVRSVAPFEGGADSSRPQLMVPVAQAVASGAVQLRERLRRPPRVPDTTAIGAGETHFLIPFGPNSARYTKLSFASVLAGDVPVETLRGRLVLIGMTASGWSRRFATPVSDGLGPLPGVYIQANVLDALLTGREIERTGRWTLFAVSLAPLAVLLAAFLVLSSFRAWLLTVALCVLAAGVSAALLYGARLWMSPVPAIVGLVVLYAAWSWRRRAISLAYLRRELHRFADEPRMLPQAQQRRGELAGDRLEQDITLANLAAQRVQDMKRFTWDILDSMPEPVLVTDVHGVVSMANRAAVAYFARLGTVSPEARPMQEVLSGLTLTNTIDHDTTGEQDNPLAETIWPAPLDPTRGEFAELMTQGAEVRDVDHRVHRLRYTACIGEQGETTGWIAHLADVSALQSAERQRDDALRLMSHDMRSPQASIIALVEMERARSAAAPERDVLERIEQYARGALAIIDDFLQLARAESQTYTLEPVNLNELMIDASDEVWPQAHAKRISLRTAGDGDDEHWINADRPLMTRVLVNILNNAVRYSPPNTRIFWRIGDAQAPDGSADGARVSCTIRDEGCGISEERHAGLFARFHSRHDQQRAEMSSAGFGMAFIKTVVTRHGGDLQVVSAPDNGTTVTIWLPPLADAHTDASAA